MDSRETWYTIAQLESTLERMLAVENLPSTERDALERELLLIRVVKSLV